VKKSVVMSPTARRKIISAFIAISVFLSAFIRVYLWLFFPPKPAI
jgi:hypothetical protein